MNKNRYRECLSFADQIELDERYALVSHYIQIGEKPESQKYKGILKQKGVAVESFPLREVFNKENGIILLPDMNPRFTFIDLFAGIGASG